MLRSLVGSEMCIRDRGGTERIPRHPNFRVFANMNPPTDVGKKDLPPSLKSRFTEFYVSDPFDPHDLTCVVTAYLSGCLLYTSDAADEEDSVDLGGRRMIKKKKRQ
eukprot:TRINITY_DN34101_c0_g1_i1.p1 TRINITY_DN34101_c0_g1~~TRINITY_DN34101_c0_g1_i1.p1  ORF type:complete len:106 (+),score=36.59 TRINITY_DN34101_c0_g1_i1:99-416(+)